MSDLISREALKEMFSYDESTGMFTRIKQTGPNALVGNIAGNLERRLWLMELKNI